MDKDKVGLKGKGEGRDNFEENVGEGRQNGIVREGDDDPQKR